MNRRLHAVIAMVGMLAILSGSAQAATGSFSLETYDANGGSTKGFDIDSARVLSVILSSVDFRLGSNPTTGYRALTALNSAGVARLGQVDYGAVDCLQMRNATYLTATPTGPSLSQDPAVDTVLLARSRLDTFIKMKVTAVDLTAPNGLAFMYQTTTCPTDTTPPSITGSASGTAGNAGWFVGDVSVSWTIEDFESPISGTDGCSPATVMGDTSGATFTCSASSAGGTASESMTVMRDATAPVVSYSGNQGTYGVDENISIGCSATDATSGVATTDCASIEGPAYSFGPGDHSFSASATDVAGNAGTGATAFTVTVTASALKGLLDDFATGSSVPPSLKQKIDALFTGGVTQGTLNGLRNEIRAQAGKKITADGAQILLEILATLG